MSSVSLNFIFRPLRIGWCIQKDDFDSLRNITRLNFAIWGGPFNPIIIVDDLELADNLVESFRPDFLISVSTSESVTNFLNRYPHLQSDIDWRDVVEDGQLTVLDIRHPISILVENRGKGLVSYEDYLTIPQWRTTDPLSDLLLLTLGQLPLKGSLKLDYAGQIIAEKIGNLVPPSDPNNVLPAGLLKSLNPYRVSRTGIMPSLAKDDSAGVFVGDSRLFFDLITFWNLRASGKSVVFYDPNHSVRLDEWLKFQIERHQKAAASSKWNESFNLYANSKELLDSNLKVFPEIPKCINYLCNLSWNKLNNNPSTMQIGSGGSLGNIYEGTETPAMSFELRDKPYLSSIDFYHQHLVISIESRSYWDKKGGQNTFSSIHCPEMNEFYSRETRSLVGSVRSEPSGLGFVVRANEDHLNIRAINEKKMIEKFFSIYGLSLKQSKAGLIAKQIFQQIGPPQGGRIFKIEGVRNLLEEFKPYQWFNFDTAINRIGNCAPGSHIPRFDKYKKLVVEFIEGRSRERGPKDAWQFLLKKKVFRAGLVTTCKSCQMEYWTSIDHIRSDLVCEYCGHSQDISPDLDQKKMKWHYRKSGLFSQENNQEGAIPVLVAIQQLHTCLSFDSNLFLLFSSEIEGKGIRCESDFIAITKGPNRTTQVILSECKSRGNIEKQDLDNLVAVTTCFPAGRFDTYILLAKLCEFSDEEIALIRQYQDEYRNRIIMMTPRELEPYDIYEETRGKFDFREHDKSPQGLANMTQNVFLDPKPLAQRA